MRKQVYDLDKDERWQTRLEKARARREVALREMAAGKGPPPRPKPWEIEGSGVDKPRPVEPVVQERGEGDKLDFADRMEAIREGRRAGHGKDAPGDASPHVGKDESAGLTAAAERPKRARPQPSLILPGAPDVAEIAARYGATLEAPDRRDLPPPDGGATPAGSLRADPESRAVPPAAAPRRRRRLRSIMVLALLAFAALPFTTTAPQFETGPAMPVITGFAAAPGIGESLSLPSLPSAPEAASVAGRIAPQPLPVPAVDPPVRVEPDLAALPAPVETAGPAGVDWAPETQAAPAASMALPRAPEGEEDLAARLAPPEAPDLPVGEATAVALPQDAALPARPPAPRPPAPAQATTAPVADPLRVTILRPARSDAALAEGIASSIARDGHELVRVQEVDASISNRNLRYFHEADRGGAARMAARYDAELRDFTWFRPKPVEGTAELWLPGDAPRASAQQSRPIDPVDTLNRVFDRLGLGIELPRGGN